MSHALDDELYPVLAHMDLFEDESVWMKDRISISHAERDAFLNNESENPRFRYRKTTPREDYVTRFEVMNQLLDKSTAPAVVIDLYRRKIKKQQLRNVMIAASVVGDDGLFNIASQEIYGKPKKKYFAYVAKQIIKLCHGQKSAHPGSARRLQKVVSKIDTSEVDITSEILPPVVTGKKVLSDVSQIKDIFQAVLDRCEISGWKLQVDEKEIRSRFSVDTANKVVHIPSERQLLSRSSPLTEVKVQALAEHEIGVHVRRVHEASNGNLRLLEVGFDNYLTGEEGLASYVQQQIEGADEYYGFDRYLAACLALGMDGQVRDFRAVFSMMVDYYTLKFSAEKNVLEPEPFKAAWDVCVRIFRGTSGQTAGAIYSKDIVYMEGNIGVWNLLSEKPQVFESLFIGKFNPLLSRHVKTLQTLEILKEW